MHDNLAGTLPVHLLSSFHLSSLNHCSASQGCSEEEEAAPTVKVQMEQKLEGTVLNNC